MEIRSKEITLVSIKKLKKKKNNRNLHGQDQIEMLAEQIKYQGFRNPIIVSNQSGEIVCGHGRYLAAIRAGLEEVPVIYQDFESPEQEYAFHVADNASANWAELDLKGINMDIGELGPDFDIQLLGIQDFTLDFAEKEFDPTDKDDKKHKVCPHCGEDI